MTSDDQQNLPAVPEKVHALEIPVAEFEGEYVRTMLGKIPGITLEMDYGYARGTHLKLELEVRVKRVAVDEVASGKNKGDLFRLHEFAIEEAKILGAYTAEQTDPGVGGGLAATGNDIEDEEDCGGCRYPKDSCPKPGCKRVEEQEMDDHPEGAGHDGSADEFPDF